MMPPRLSRPSLRECLAFVFKATPASAAHAERPASGPSPSRAVVWGSVLLLSTVLSLAVYGRWLFYRAVPSTPAQDLAKHVAMALNFKAAVADGQWIPRLQIHHPLVPDAPVFQYYGFMTGLSAFVFLLLGLSGMRSVAASLVLLRSLGLTALYGSSRLLGLPRPAALLAMFLFVFEPYSISVLYGRVAVSEFHAHSFLPFLLLAYAFTQAGYFKYGFLTTTLTFFLIAITHSIFFLYGSLFFSLVVLLSSLSFRARLYLFFGFIAGVAAAGYQWLPAFLSAKDLSFNFFFYSPFKWNSYTDWRGLLGMYKPMAEHGDGARYFFTYSWWTLPGLIGLKCYLPAIRSRFVLSLTGFVFLLLSLGRIDVWSHLPQFTYALQFPYRLIPFVSLVCCVGAAALLNRYLKPAGLFLFAIIVVFSTLKVLSAPAFDKFLTDVPDHTLQVDFAEWDYLAFDRAVGNAAPGILADDDRSSGNLATNVVAGDFWLREDNEILGNGRRNIDVNLQGRSIFTDHAIFLSLVSTGMNPRRVSRLVALPPGGVHGVELATNAPVGSARIVASETLVPAEFDHNPSGDRRHLSVHIESLTINGVPIVGITKAELLSHHGLSRSFRARVARTVGNPASEPTNRIPVALPTAYSRFLRGFQNGVAIPITSAADASAVAWTDPRLDGLIRTEYRVPLLAELVSLIGFAGIIAGGIWIGKHPESRAWQSTSRLHAKGQ